MLFVKLQRIEEMNKPVTVLAPIKLANGKCEADLLAASTRFQNEFVSSEPGIIRRELVRKSDGTYLDIIQFRSEEEAMAVIDKEKESDACHAFFSVMDLGAEDESGNIEFYPSLETYVAR